MLMHATELMVAQRFVGEVAFLRGRGEVIVLPPPCPIDVQPADFGHAAALMSRAESNARVFLAGLDDGVVPLHARRRDPRVRSSARVGFEP